MILACVKMTLNHPARSPQQHDLGGPMSLVLCCCCSLPLPPSEALGQSSLAADSCLGPCLHSSFLPAPLASSSLWLWINSLWQMHGSPLPFLCVSESGPDLIASMHPSNPQSVIPPKFAQLCPHSRSYPVKATHC